jgi:hypothetical protein
MTEAHSDADRASHDDIETIIREADAAAQRLRRKLCLPICQREDLGQDLLIDLLRRLSAYDPSRGNIGAGPLWERRS